MKDDEIDALRKERDAAKAAAIYAFVTGADWLRLKLTGFTSFGSERGRGRGRGEDAIPVHPARSHGRDG